jgi:hypothetical protein
MGWSSSQLFRPLAGAQHSGDSVGLRVADEPADERSGAPGRTCRVESRRPAFYRFTRLLTRLVESERRESNPHDQLGRLVTHSGRALQLAAVTSRYDISAPLRWLFG